MAGAPGGGAHGGAHGGVAAHGGAAPEAALGLVAPGPEESAFWGRWLSTLAAGGLSPLRLLLVSPTRAGAEALEGVLAGVCGRLALARPLTLPALAQRVLDRHGHLLALGPARRVLHGEQEWLLLSSVLQGLALPGPLARQRSRPGFVRQCLNFFNWLRSNDIGPGSLETAAAPGSTAGALAVAYRAYLDRLRAGGLWGFGDLAPAAARLLRECPEAAQWWRERWECLGVARCHDLSPAGFSLLRRLLPLGSGGPGAGATAGTLPDAEAAAVAGAQPPGLEGGAAAGAPRLAFTLDPRLWQARLAAPPWFTVRDAWREFLEGLRPSGSPPGALGPSGPPPGSRAGPPPGARAPRVAAFGDQAEEVAWVAQELKRLGEAGVDWGDLVVRYAGPEPASGLEGALEAAGVPFQPFCREAEGGGLLPAVLAWLAALRDPADDRAVRAWLVSTLGPGPAFAARAAESARHRGLSLLEAALGEAARPPEAGRDGAEPSRGVLELFSSLRSALDQGAGAVSILAALLERGVFGRLAEAGAQGPEGAARAAAWAGGARRLLEALEVMGPGWPAAGPGGGQETLGRRGGQETLGRGGGQETLGRGGGPDTLEALALWLEALGGPGAAAEAGWGAPAVVEGEGGEGAAGPGAGAPGAVRVLPLAEGAPGPCHSVFVVDAVADAAPRPPFLLLEPEELAALASALGPLLPPPRLDPASALALKEARLASALDAARSGACVSWAARMAGGPEGSCPLPLVAGGPEGSCPLPLVAGGPGGAGARGEAAPLGDAVPPGEAATLREPAPLGEAVPPGRPVVAGGVAPARRRPGGTPAPCSLPDHLSPSSLRAYLACPRQFYYRHLLGLEEPASAESLLGDLVHRALAVFFGRHPDLSRLGPAGVPEEALRALEEVWAGLGGGAGVARALGGAARAVALRGRAARLLLPYLEGQAKGWEAGRRCVAVEAGVSLALGGFSLRGRVDRVDALPAGGHELIDYKTGRGDRQAEAGLKAQFLPPAGQRPQDFQLLVYCLGAQEARAFEPGFLGIHQLGYRGARASFALRRVQVAPADPGTSGPKEPRLSGGDLEAGRAGLLGVLEEMARGYFPPRPRQSHDCARCGFRPACPARGEEAEADE